MKIIETRAGLQDWSDAERASGRRVALVPTMGALHPGHVSLVREARRHADRVVVSIFVNPTQFNDPKDFDGYPRTLESDLEACRAAGADVVWTPRADELYPAGAATWVDVEGLTDPLCGASRPGHFRGVTTVVTKLFLAARPHVAVFGQKDFQQLAVIRRMTADLGFGLEIVGAPTVREADGLAMSSRNVRLGPRARAQALRIVESLDLAQALLRRGERSHAAILEAVTKKLGEASQATIHYADLRDPTTLEPAPAVLEGPTLLAIALLFQKDPDGRGAEVRLIDNRVLEVDPA
ncbi:MAG: pantoate--beta-alanine ligase [Spirochaetaceae bacterium]|nr:pantoate--beta-alanine ligase [Myxococcales bacterium]MCB9724435.1 pantoate--beta-alanine ligase [Spirochaetaceae bacterium]HPG25306.1 pantoate--beta-alanine ligase [Myxococcota bacterium]